MLTLLSMSGISTQNIYSQNQREVKYLSGTDNLHTISWDFYCTGGRNSGKWTKIQVPSCWEQEGFGTYNYGRDYKTYGNEYSFAKEQGLYRHHFDIPAGWKDRHIRLVFEGSMTDTEVRVNGELAGAVHQGSFYRFSYDISHLLKANEENLLEVKVSKWSDDHSVNRAERYADYWIFGGIFRPVYLESFPEQHIPQLCLWGSSEGEFNAQVQLSGQARKQVLEAIIIGPDGETFGSCKTGVGKDDSLVLLNTRVEDALLWTSETPHLYTARLILRQGEKILYQTEEKFGFRTVEIRKGDGIYINGSKVKMKGVNRHAFWPESGRTLNREIDLLDVQLMKEMNMNAVRCSHYPPDKAFLEICDSLGLYVLDELAGWQNAYATDVGEKLVQEMVERDLNHPSVIFWSNGNEGGTNKELDQVFLKYDPSGRQVLHCHHRPGNDFNGIETNHYESYQSTASILDDSLIYMTTEFLHGQNDGGAGAGLYDYWELMHASERSAGGFLWALIDEGIVRTDWNRAIDVNLVNAPDGILGPHREKEASFYSIREIFSPVKMNLNSLAMDFQGEIPLENRFYFTNLENCIFQWQLLDYPSPDSFALGTRVLYKRKQAGPNMAPGATGILHLDLPEIWQQAMALQVEAIDPSGASVISQTWPIGQQLPWLSGRLEQENEGGVLYSENDSLLTMSAGKISMLFDKQTGILTEIKNEKTRIISFRNGPLPCNGKAEFAGLEHYQEGSNHILEVSYKGGLDRARWTMYPGGWVKLEYDYSPGDSLDFAGISFDFEENKVISARWLGKGPYRVWKNRMSGSEYGLWEKAYNNTMAGSYPWVFPEFKGHHAGVKWMELNTLDGKILVATPDQGLFVRLFDFYAFPAPTRAPALPPGDISFLDAIPPIGTKMSTSLNASAASTGPLGEKNILRDSYSHTLYFNFGIIP